MPEKKIKETELELYYKRMHVVVMFEPACPGEKLKLSEQVNEIFGPFSTGENAEAWCKRAADLIKNREWLIIPLSDTSLTGLELKIYEPEKER